MSLSFKQKCSNKLVFFSFFYFVKTILSVNVPILVPVPVPVVVPIPVPIAVPEVLIPTI